MITTFFSGVGLFFPGGMLPTGVNLANQFPTSVDLRFG